MLSVELCRLCHSKAIVEIAFTLFLTERFLLCVLSCFGNGVNCRYTGYFGNLTAYLLGMAVAFSDLINGNRYDDIRQSFIAPCNLLYKRICHKTDFTAITVLLCAYNYRRSLFVITAYA